MAQRVAFRLYRAAEAAGQLGNESLQPLGINARQYGVLTLLTDRAPRPQQEIAAQLRVDRTTMVGLIDELESLGLVERGRDPADRRAYALRPTKAGRALQARAAKLQESCEARFLQPLTPAERESLFQLLLKLEPPRDPPHLPF